MDQSFKSLRRLRTRSKARLQRHGERFRPSFEPLETRLALTLPFGALPNDTAEYMLGEVYVNLVLMESNGGLDTDTEEWTPALIQEVKDKVSASLQWWEDALVAQGLGANPLNFTLGTTYADNPVSTPYEPIANVSDFFELWIQDFFNVAGFNNHPDFNSNIREFNNAQRIANSADWSFTIFVPNSSNDVDDRFETGGSFTGAFAYAGGELIVAPSGRPLSTFTHEVGHMFWAFDEYAGSKSYFDHRGYYNTQNLNATDQNPNPSGRSPSIMSNGVELTTAFDNHTSATSTLQMIGWRDSDNDGIVDVLDVPHHLSGHGDFNPANRVYHFSGESSVATLPNLNPSGLQNDITINRISRAQYRIDNGAWQTAATYNTSTALLDFDIGPIAAGTHTIEIRTIDDRTGVTSPSFIGSTERDSSTLLPGINGFIWNDVNANGIRDPSESGLAGWTVQLVDNSLAPITLERSIEPDAYPQDTVLNTVSPYVTLTAIGSGVTTNQVIARDRSPSSTGTKTFTHVVFSGVSASWTDTSRLLRIDFASPVSTLSIDAIGNGADPFDYGRLEAYDSSGNLVGRYTTQALATGEVETMTLSLATPTIKFAIAKAHNGTALHLDNLRFGPRTSVATDTDGAFAIPYLSAGAYNVLAQPISGYTISAPIGALRTVVLAEGESKPDIDFGAATTTVSSGWHNDNLPEDIDGNGVVNNTDLFLILNELRVTGPHALSGSPGSPIRYWDVHSDGVINNTDMFLVLAKVRAQQNGEGSGDDLPGSGGGASGSSGGEGLIDVNGFGIPSLLADLLPDVFADAADPLRYDLDDHHHHDEQDDSSRDPSHGATNSLASTNNLFDPSANSLTPRDIFLAPWAVDAALADNASSASGSTASSSSADPARAFAFSARQVAKGARSFLARGANRTGIRDASQLDANQLAGANADASSQNEADASYLFPLDRDSDLVLWFRPRHALRPKS